MILTRKNLTLLAAGLLVGLGLGLLVIFGLGFSGALLDKLGLSRFTGEAPLVPEASSPAPDFELAGLDGETIRLSDLRGQPVLINFWATWCGPCRLEMPLLEEYQQRYAGKFRLLGVNYDEPDSAVQSFVDELSLTFTILLDPGGKVNNLYRVRAFPSTLFVDADGVVRFRHIGTLTEEQLSGYLKKLGVVE